MAQDQRCQACGASISAYSDTGLCFGCRPLAGRQLSHGAPNTALLIPLLEEYRRSEGLTQRDLGDSLGLSQPQVSKLLSGERHLTEHIARKAVQFLGIDLDQVGLPPTVSDWMTPDTLTVASSAVGMAALLRNLGQVQEAGLLFGPVLERLERAYRAGQNDPDLALILCDARIVNATIVGDLSTEEEHRRSVNAAMNAKAIARIYGGSELRTQVLNLEGNQRRVMGDLDGARKALDEGVNTSQHVPLKIASHSWLARVAAEQGDEETFDTNRTAARRLLEDANLRTPLLNPLSMGEIEARGLNQLGHPVDALNKLEELDRTDAAPQWGVLADITKGEALLASGNIPEGIETLRQAMLKGYRLGLPHQLQRVQRAADASSHPDARELAADVTVLLRKSESSDAEQ